MRKRIIIGLCMIVIGMGVLGVFSAYTLGIAASVVLIVFGLILALMSRTGRI